MATSEIETLLTPIRQFLKCDTPDEWIDFAKQPENLPHLLIDHCHCELKAAQTAIWLLRRYAVDKESAQAILEWIKPYELSVYKQQPQALLYAEKTPKYTLKAQVGNPYSNMILDKMVCLIQEELQHFRMVLDIMQKRNIAYLPLPASGYAKGIVVKLRTHEPANLIDKLIMGAYIEARSCERFAKIAPHLDEDLTKFYTSLLKSEARHFADYLELAGEIAGEDITDRIHYIGDIEASMICAPDPVFRFHSGIPV